MKTHAIAVGALVSVFALPALAQNSNARDWSGYYLGVNTGIRWNQAKAAYAAFSSPPNFEATVHNHSIIEGAQFGYDHEFSGSNGRWIFGLEGDADFAYQSPNLILGPPTAPGAILRCPPGFRGPLPPPPGLCVVVSSHGEDNRSFSMSGEVSARLRAGVAWRNALLYFTTGIGAADTRVTGQASSTHREVPFGLVRQPSFPQMGPDSLNNPSIIESTRFATGTANADILGWTLGLGAEVYADSKVSIALEYRYADYGRHTYRFDPVFTGDSTLSLAPPSPTAVAITDNRVTIRFNYHFQ